MKFIQNSIMQLTRKIIVWTEYAATEWSAGGVAQGSNTAPDLSVAITDSRTISQAISLAISVAIPDSCNHR